MPDLTVGDCVIADDQAHHGLHVMRLREGATVTLFDGRGVEAVGRVCATERNELTVGVEEIPPARGRPDPVIELAFAIPKGKRVDWLLEKATELGTASLQPVAFERSVAGGEDLSANKWQRWLSHCISAARQCGLRFLPELRGPIALLDYLDGCSADFRLAGEVAQEAGSVYNALADWQAGQTIAILIGPEGDLTDAERSAAHERGFRPAHLGHTTLRVETAAMALSAAVVAICDHLAAQGR
ncbi:MAG: RsmE family RNA methyltransferase [Planctomycetota bacterium]